MFLERLKTCTLGKIVPPDAVREYIDIFKELQDVFTCSYEEILGINPCIVVHEIKTYMDANPIQQRL